MFFISNNKRCYIRAKILSRQRRSIKCLKFKEKRMAALPYNRANLWPAFVPAYACRYGKRKNRLLHLQGFIALWKERHRYGLLDRESLGKRPLSKLTKDLLHDLGLKINEWGCKYHASKTQEINVNMRRHIANEDTKLSVLEKYNERLTITQIEI